MLTNASIVFVHGLMGDPIKTWAKGDVLWPKDVLSKSFPRARIMTYGYDADVAKFFQRVAAVSVFGNSQMLIRAVNRERRRSPGRPLIFIAHSLGGILVKDVCRPPPPLLPLFVYYLSDVFLTMRVQGLIWSKSQAGFSDIHVENVFLSTKGVIFLGTPHRGASGHYTQFGTVLQRVVSAMMYQTNPALLEALDRDGEVLPRIGEEWARMTHPRPFNMFSFVETLPMTVASFVGKVRIRPPIFRKRRLGTDLQPRVRLLMRTPDSRDCRMRTPRESQVLIILRWPSSLAPLIPDIGWWRKRSRVASAEWGSRMSLQRRVRDVCSNY